MAKSIILSTRHMLSDTGEHPSKEWLKTVSEEIRRGVPYVFDEFEITRVLHLKRAGERRWTSHEKRQVTWFFILLLFIPTACFIWLLVRLLKH